MPIPDEAPIPLVVKSLMSRGLSENVICAAAGYTTFCEDSFKTLYEGRSRQMHLRRHALLKLANLRAAATNGAAQNDQKEEGREKKCPSVASPECGKLPQQSNPESDLVQSVEPKTSAADVVGVYMLSLPELMDYLLRAGVDAKVLCAAAGYAGFSEDSIERVRRGSCRNREDRLEGLRRLHRSLTAPMSDGYCLETAPLRFVVAELLWKGFENKVIAAAASYKEFNDDYVEQLVDGRCSKHLMRRDSLLKFYLQKKM